MITILIFAFSILFANAQLETTPELISEINSLSNCSNLMPKYRIHMQGFVKDCNPAIDTMIFPILKYINDNLDLTQESLRQITEGGAKTIKIPLKPIKTKGYPDVLNSPDKKTTKVIQSAIQDFVTDNPKERSYDSIIIYSVTKCDYYKDLVDRLFYQGITIDKISTIKNREDFFRCVKSYMQSKQKHFDDFLKLKTSSYLMTEDNIEVKLIVPSKFKTISVNHLTDLNISKLTNGYTISYRPTNIGGVSCFGLYLGENETEFYYSSFNSFTDTELKVEPIKIDKENFVEYMGNLRYNGH